MDVWVAVFVALFILMAGCIVTYVLTRSKIEKTSERQRQELADALAALESQRKSFGETAKAVEETARRKALDEFLGDMRVEERRYVREHRVLFAHRKSLVLQERIFFRNIPLSNWVEHEVPVEEGADLDTLARTLSVFNGLELEAGANQRRQLPFA
jgi:outer membrane murein-binding lipoprotein Lpp